MALIVFGFLGAFVLRSPPDRAGLLILAWSSVRLFTQEERKLWRAERELKPALGYLPPEMIRFSGLALPTDTGFSWYLWVRVLGTCSATRPLNTGGIEPNSAFGN